MKSIFNTRHALTAVLLLSSYAQAANGSTYVPPSYPDQKWSETSLIKSPVRPQSQNCIYVDADFIYWTAREEGLDFALTSHATSQVGGPAVGSTSPNGANLRFFPNKDGKINEMHQKFGPGFKVSAGYNLPRDGWDLYANYTRYHHHQTKRTSIAPGEVNKQIYSQWFDGALSANNGALSGAKAKWDLHFDTIDLEVGRAYWLGQYVSIRPHMGLKYASILQHLYINQFGITNLPGNAVVLPSAGVSLKNKFWGLGGRMGLDTSYFLSKEWSLFGDVSLSLLYGLFHLKNDGPVSPPTRTAGRGNAVNYDFKDSYHSLKPAFEYSIGVRWEMDLGNNCYHLALDAAWEQQFWLHQNQLQRMTILDYVTQHGNLGLMGLTAGARLDF